MKNPEALIQWLNPAPGPPRDARRWTPSDERWL